MSLEYSEDYIEELQQRADYYGMESLTEEEQYILDKDFIKKYFEFNRQFERPTTIEWL